MITWNPNFITKLATTAFIGITSIFGVVNPAEARPSHTVSFTTSQATAVYFKPVGYNGVQVTVNNEYQRTGFIGNMDCSTGRYQWRANDGYTKSQIDSILTDACNY